MHGANFSLTLEGSCVAYTAMCPTSLSVSFCHILMCAQPLRSCSHAGFDVATALKTHSKGQRVQQDLMSVYMDPSLYCKDLTLDPSERWAEGARDFAVQVRTHWRWRNAVPSLTPVSACGIHSCCSKCPTALRLSSAIRVACQSTRRTTTRSSTRLQHN